MTTSTSNLCVKVNQADEESWQGLHKKVESASVGVSSYIFSRILPVCWLVGVVGLTTNWGGGGGGVLLQLLLLLNLKGNCFLLQLEGHCFQPLLSSRSQRRIF